MSYTNGHKKYDGLSIASVGFAIASFTELPDDIADRVNALAARDPVFSKALTKEIARWRDEWELCEMLTAKPKLGRLLQMQGTKRNWRKLAELC